MPTFFFHGRVHPERRSLSLAPRRFPLWKSGNLSIQFTLTIAEGSVTVVVDVEGDIDLHTLKNSVWSFVHGQVDSAGFVEDLAYDVEIITATDLAGATVVFERNGPHMVDDLVMAEKLVVSLSDHATRSLELRRALADYRDALRDPINTAFYCYRAIESITQSFGTKQTSWEAMRQALLIDKGIIMDLKKSGADAQRHGVIDNTAELDRQWQVRVTRRVILRYLDYLKGGGALPGGTPVLVEP